MANYAANFVHICSVSKLKNIVMQEKERKKWHKPQALKRTSKPPIV